MAIVPLVVDRREIRTADTNQVINNFDFYGDKTAGGAYGLREMTTQEFNEFKKWIRFLWVRNKTVTLTYVASGGNLGAMIDTRYQAGAYQTDVTNFDTQAETPDISEVPTTWDKINLNYDTSVAMPNVKDYAPSRPLRLGTTPSTRGKIYEYSHAELGELIAEAIGEVGGGGVPTMTVGRIGGYSIFRQDNVPSGNHDDGATFTDMGRVFEDTIANAAAYTAAGIPETLDQPLALDNANRWNLYSMDTPATVSTPVELLYRDTNGGVREWSLANMQQFFEPAAQHIAANGYNGAGDGKLIWYIHGLGGSGSIYPVIDEMADERLNGSSAAGYTQYYVNTDDYRTQEFPNGTAQVVSTYSLRAYTQ